MTLHMSPFAAFGLVLISLIICAALAGMVTAWIWAIGRLWKGQRLLPSAKPRAVPWGTGSVLLVLVVYVLINIGVALAYLRMTGALRGQRKPTLAEQMTVVSLMNGLLLVVIPLSLRLTSRAPLSALGLESRGMARQALVGATAFLLASPVVYMVNLLAVTIWKQHKHPLEQMVMAEPNARILALAFLSAVVLAPAAEELLFRGIIQSWIAQLWRRREEYNNDVIDVRDRWQSATAVLDTDEVPAATVPESVTPVAVEGELFTGRWSAPAPDEEVGIPERSLTDQPAQTSWIAQPSDSLAPIVITSALFAAVHLPQWPAPIAIFFLSVGLGLVYQRTGSLFASFLMHALFNGFSTLILFQAVLIGHPTDPKVVPTATCICTHIPLAAAADAPMRAAIRR
jgi:membrane protease YdiL (CAAX protease family)